MVCENDDEEEDAERGSRDNEEVHRDQIADVVAVRSDLGSRRSMNVRHVCEGGSRARTMYLATVVSGRVAGRLLRRLEWQT